MGVCPALNLEFIFEYIKTKYDINVTDDEADAICIAEAGSEVEVKNE
mgnify:CR=1 FL=1